MTGEQVKLDCSRPELAGFQDYYEQEMHPTLVQLEEQPTRKKPVNCYHRKMWQRSWPWSNISDPTPWSLLSVMKTFFCPLKQIKVK